MKYTVPLLAALCAAAIVMAAYRPSLGTSAGRALPESAGYTIFQSPIRPPATIGPNGTMPAFDGALTFVYPTVLVLPVVLKAISIRPPAPLHAWEVNYRYINVKWRQTPGTAYTIDIPPLPDIHGFTYPAVSFPVRAGTPPPIPTPAPTPIGKSSSYYLGAFGPSGFAYAPGNGKAIVRIPDDPQNRMEIDQSQVFAIASAFRSSA